MDKLSQLRIFARLAERGSFSAVARDFEVTQSAISKALSNLETALGVRLVSRSTRSVSLTDAGRRFYERCRQILADLEDAEASLRDAQTTVTGTLNIATPVPFGLMFISPRVVRFKAMHPALAINLDLNDQPLNLVEQNIDVAIRLGHLSAPGLAARKLGKSPFVCVASPVYLHSRGTPLIPEDLPSHHCLTYSILAKPLEWEFPGLRAPSHISVASSYQSNNLLALKDAAVAGIGIARLPLWMVDAEIKSGALNLVLASSPIPSYDIHAVFPSVRKIPKKVTLFVDFIQHELASISYFFGERRHDGFPDES